MLNYVYKPIVDKNKLYIGEGKSLIITGWLDPNIVVNELSKSEYACIGTLYNVNSGLTPLFQNLLANPYTYIVYILSCTNNDRLTNSSKTLFKLIETIYKEPDQVEFIENKHLWDISINHNNLVQYTCSISKAISIEQIKLVCTNLAWHTCFIESKDIKDCINTLKTELQNVRNTKHIIEQYNQPIYIEIPMFKTNIHPADNFSHQIKADSVLEAYIKANQLVRKNGLIRNNEYKHIQELINLTSIITPHTYDVLDDSNYDVNVEYNKEFIRNYLPTIMQPNYDFNQSNDTSYTYGQRIFSYQLSERVVTNQIQNLIEKLFIDNEHNTQLYISLWNVDKDRNNTNPPCLVSLNLRLVDNKVHMIATFRSHDIYGAYFSNCLALVALLKYITDEINNYIEDEYADELDIFTKYIPGKLIINSLSAHIYADNFAKADQLVESLFDNFYKVKRYDDKVGNFIINYVGFKVLDKSGFITNEGIVYPIQVENNRIEVVQTDSTGKEIKKYYGYFPEIIIKDILKDNPSIDKHHLAYLSIELDKVYHLKDNYKQDIRKSIK